MTMAATPAQGAVSHAKLWQTKGGDLDCGVAIHGARESARILCSGTGIPAPKKGVGFGDPGFVFLGARGRPVLARLSQDTFEGTSTLVLAPGASWKSAGVSCSIHVSSIRCVNRSGHGFTSARHSYAAF